MPSLNVDLTFPYLTVLKNDSWTISFTVDSKVPSNSGNAEFSLSLYLLSLIYVCKLRQLH